MPINIQRASRILLAAALAVPFAACSASPTAPGNPAPKTVTTSATPPPVDSPPTVPAPPPAPPAPGPVPTPAPAPPDNVVGTLTITAIDGTALGPLYHVGDQFPFALRVASGKDAVAEWSLCDGPMTWKAPDKWVGTCRHAPPMAGEWEMEVRGRSVTLFGRHPLGSLVVIYGDVR